MANILIYRKPMDEETHTLNTDHHPATVDDQPSIESLVTMDHTITNDSGRIDYAVRELGSFPPGTVAGWFTRNEKIGRALWSVVQSTAFRFSPKRADGFRAGLLRLFGATIRGRPKILRRTIRVEVPWNIMLGERVQIGDDVHLYSLGRIEIGSDTVVSQYSHLCAGTHDYSDTEFPLRRVPISIGDHCWIATDSYIAPGVRIGDGVVVGARSSVVKDLPAWKVCVGSPAKPIADRPLLDLKSGRRLDPMEGQV